MDPRMGVKPGVGMHQIGMRNAPQAGMAGICLGHEHGGNDDVMTAASQAGFSLRTPESACACRFASTGNVCSFCFSTCGVLTHWLYGATAAHMIPDQKVGSSNLSVVIFSSGGWDARHETNYIDTVPKLCQQHQWSSGRIHRCHRCDPGSIPG